MILDSKVKSGWSTDTDVHIMLKDIFLEKHFLSMHFLADEKVGTTWSRRWIYSCIQQPVSLA